MNKTRKVTDTMNSITVSADILAELLNCGKSTAMKIGAESGSRIQIGRRVLYSVPKVREYMDSLAGK